MHSHNFLTHKNGCENESYRRNGKIGSMDYEWRVGWKVRGTDTRKELCGGFGVFDIKK